MATKIKMLKLLQEMRGFADFTNRRPQAQPPGLFLLQMRSHVLHTRFFQRKRTLPIDVQGAVDIPHPVRIKHVKGGAVRAAVSPVH